MKKRWSGYLVITTIVFLVLAFMAVAVDKSDAVSGGSLTVGTSGRLTNTGAGSKATRAGNVTQVDVTSTKSTVKWAGYFGQVTTALQLGYDSNVLYNFGSGNNSQIKSVFAAPDALFDFSNLLAASVGAVDSAWGFSITDKDSATSAFNGTTTIATVASVPAANLISYNAMVAFNATVWTGGNQNNTAYKSGLFTDLASPVQEFDFAFGVAVDADKRDFRNTTVVDYELMVPVNTTGAGTETYYFFLDVE